MKSLILILLAVGTLAAQFNPGGGSGSGGSSGALTSPNSSITFGTGTADVSTAYLNGLYAQLAASNTFVAGFKQIFTSSASTAGARIVGAAIPSTLVGGDLGFTSPGIHWSYDGTNVNFHPYVAGSGTTAPAAPTVGHCPQWGAAFSLTDVVCAAGANPAGSGSEFQYRASGTTFAALANSSVPNAGEILLTTTPSNTATRAILGLGAAPANCPTATSGGCYHSVNAATGFVGDFLHYELNSVNQFRVFPQSGANGVSIFLGPSNGFGTEIRKANNAQDIAIYDQNGNPNPTLAAAKMAVLSAGFSQMVRMSASSGPGGNGSIDVYNSRSTAGAGTVPVYGVISSIAQTAAISTATLCAAASCTVGQYAIRAYIDSTVTCATPGPGTVGLTLTWTDETGTKSAVTVPMVVNGGATLLTTMALGNTTNWASGTLTIWTSGANAIQYATTYTACTSGTGTYSLRIWAEQGQ